MSLEFHILGNPRRPHRSAAVNHALGALDEVELSEPQSLLHLVRSNSTSNERGHRISVRRRLPRGSESAVRDSDTPLAIGSYCYRGLIYNGYSRCEFDAGYASLCYI